MDISSSLQNIRFLLARRRAFISESSLILVVTPSYTSLKYLLVDLESYWASVQSVV
jgi:hypothetical protein